MAVHTTQFRRNPLKIGSTAGTANTQRLPSPSIWDRFPWAEIRRGEVDGVVHYDDFDSMPLIGTQTTEIGYDKYKVFATSTGSFTPNSAVNSVDLGSGIGVLLHDSTADHSVALAQAYPAYKISGSVTTSNVLCFECRLAVKSLLTLRNGFLVGLAETTLWTLATGVPFNADAAAITNGAAFIGFNKWEIVSTTAASTTSLPGGINTSYSDRATTFTQVQADAAIMSAAFTFIKLGFRYDPFDTVAAIRFFVDGVEQTSVLTNTQLLATTNLKANSLGLIIASVAAANVSTDAVYLDWWRVGQVAV